MTEPPPPTSSQALQDLTRQGPLSAHSLLPLVYDELRVLARARMAREPVGHTIQATMLVHEAYLRLVGEADPGWNGRGHFFGAAALAMRRILIDEALTRLEREDPRKGRIVELRYFAGLTGQETAEALGVSVGTIEREWRFIRAWLQAELGDPDEG